MLAVGLLLSLISVGFAGEQTLLDRMVEQIQQDRYLDWSDVRTVDNLTDLRILRNAIYARHGYRFKSSELTAYFKRYSWYKPDKDQTDDLLTEADYFNREVIVYREIDIRIQDVIRSTPKLPLQGDLKKLVGIWQDSPVMADGWGYSLAFYPNGIVIERTEQGDCTRRVILRLGTWLAAGEGLNVFFYMQLVLKGGRLVPSDEGCGSDQQLIEALPVWEEIPKAAIRNLSYTSETPDTEFAELNRVYRLLDGKKMWKMGEDPDDYE